MVLSAMSIIKLQATRTAETIITYSRFIGTASPRDWQAVVALSINCLHFHVRNR